MFTYSTLLIASAFAADIISYEPKTPSMDDHSLNNTFEFIPTKAGIVYFSTPPSLKLSQCAFTVKQSDIGKAVTVAVGGVPVFDGTPSAISTINSTLYEEDTCTSHNSSISINRQIGNATSCKSTGDPHYLSSFGSKFSFQDEGFFTLFNSSHLAVQVFQKKFGAVSVNQAVAIRYGNEVHILDLRTQNAKERLRKVHGDGQKFVIYTSPTKKVPMHQIRFSPCSSTITIKVNTWRYGSYLDITINAAAFYSHSGITGICGAKEAPANLTSFAIPDSRNYFKNRFENLEGPYDTDYKKVVHCVIPKDVCNSFGNSTASSSTTISTTPVTSQITTYSSSSDSSEIPITTYSSSSDSSDIPITTSTSSISSEISITSPTGTSTNSTTSLPTDDSSVLPNGQSTSTSSPGSTPTDIPSNFNQTVQTICTSLAVAINCGGLIDVDYYTQACISDCHGTESLAPIEPAKLQMNIDCKLQTDQQVYHPDPNKAQVAADIQVSLGFYDNKCLNSCSNNGKCESTGCVCNTGYTGLGCETNLNVIDAPVSEFYPQIIYPETSPVQGDTPILGEATYPSDSAPTDSGTEVVLPGLGSTPETDTTEPGAGADPAGSGSTSETNSSIEEPIQTQSTESLSSGGTPGDTPTEGQPAIEPPIEGIYSPASPVYTTSATFVSIMLLIVNLF